jgi:hypothetical protein
MLDKLMRREKGEFSTLEGAIAEYQKIRYASLWFLGLLSTMKWFHFCSFCLFPFTPRLPICKNIVDSSGRLGNIETLDSKVKIFLRDAFMKTPAFVYIFGKTLAPTY